MKLWVTEADPTRGASNARAVARARRALGDAGASIVSAARELSSLPVLVGEVAPGDEGKLGDAQAILTEVGLSVLVGDAPPESKRPEQPEGEATDEDDGEAGVSLEASRTATLIIGTLDGNLINALALARRMGHTSGDVEFYKAVEGELLAAFPPLDARELLMGSGA